MPVGDDCPSGEDPTCGNSFVNADVGEVCDDGVNDGSYNGCNDDCLSRPAFCGDGITDSEHGEHCDDGQNGDPCDGCLDDCTYAASADAVDCPTIAFGAIGGNCDNDADCGLGAEYFCIDEDEGWPSDGFCTRMNCSGAADCGTGSFCAHLLPVGGVGNLDGLPEYMCLPECSSQGVCPTGTICQGRLMGLVEIETGATCLPGDPEAKDGDACDGPHDCNANSTCLTGYEAPGGYCIGFGCDIENNTGCHGEDSVCVPLGESDFGLCLQTCTLSGGECREGEGYRCQPGGFFGVCSHTQIGDPCSDDSDCGLAPWDCRTDEPGGYCTPSGCTVGTACSEDSYCWDPDGPGGEPAYCLVTCYDENTTIGCRAGYLCLDVGGSLGCRPDPF